MCDFSKYGGKSQDWLAVEAALPPPPVFESLEERKRIVNQGREDVSAKAMILLSPSIRMTDYYIETRDGARIEARAYRPASVYETARLPVYIHLHGGGYLFGTLSSEDAICTRIACGSKVTVVNVNYRHTPEATYPMAWDDAEDAFFWVHDHIHELLGDGHLVLIGGISAGAQLAAALTLKQHTSPNALSKPKIAGQVLMIPCVVHTTCYESHLQQLKDPILSSYIDNEYAPILPMTTVKFFADFLKIRDADSNDLRLNPGNASSELVKGLPPTVLGIAGLDPLRDEGLLYGKKLAEAGVPTDIHIFKGLPHGFRRFGEQIKDSARWDRVMEGGIRWAISNPDASGKFVVQ
ncbi:Alpha/Beta hydrolase protein [Dactylonectria estremocensis]|uniref:Alpha/Beta hydrolase protein n=1 Tax=Dactylonectria estremocensis TaxID=1079267 RepID=A0A9P9IBS7_9HYPO|nr:Alpha/Beta hydrolase protein [Dactylonectria estremocensis]